MKQKLIRQTITISVLLGILLLSFVAAMSPVLAAPQEGKWVLSDVVVHDSSDEINLEYQKYQGTGLGDSYIRYADRKVSMYQTGYTSSSGDDSNFQYNGEISWSEPPKEFSSEKIREVKLTVTGSVSGIAPGQRYVPENSMIPPYSAMVPELSIAYHLIGTYAQNGYFTDAAGNLDMKMEDDAGGAITSLTKELSINADTMRAIPGDRLQFIVLSGYTSVAYVYVFDGEPGFQGITSDASETAGETPFTVATAIVIGLTGLGVALAGAAGAASSGGPSSGSSTGQDGDGEDTGSTYKMIVYKEFGNKIGYDKPAVFVYARMVEVKPDGIEVPRPDLTGRIQILSETAELQVGTAAMAGDYIGAAVAAVSSNNPKQDPREGLILFKFVGKGGVFQNHLRFIMTGAPYVALDAEKLFVLATSGRCFELGYELVDFLKEPKVSLNVMQEGPPFTLALGTSQNTGAVGKKVITATDADQSSTFTTFFNSFACEIIAENDTEYARTVFYVVQCYEGILPDFLGKPAEIRAHQVSLESEEMVKTRFDVKLGQWSEEEKCLAFVVPESLEVSASDEEGIFACIGVEIERDPEDSRDDAIGYIAAATTNLPSEKPVPGTLSLTAALGEKTFENDVAIQLMPDIELYKAEYQANFDKEYALVKKVIEIYIPSPFKERKLAELERARTTLGIADFRLYRRNIWNYAQTCVMQEQASYLADEAWYDEAIATAELMVYIGDIAFGLAMGPIGGPIAGFIADQVKSSFLEVCELYVKGTDKSFGGLLWEYGKKRFIQSAGAADGLIEVPKVNQPGKLALWLSLYTLYRIGYHLQFDKDEAENSIGLSEAIKRGLLDFIGKGAGALLGDYLTELGKGRWVERISVTDKDQKIVNDAVSKGAKKGFDALDKAAGQADELVAKTVAVLLSYLDKLKAGLS